MSVYNTLENGNFSLGHRNIANDPESSSYRKMMKEVSAGKSTIKPYVASPPNPVVVRDDALAALVHDLGGGRIIQCRPHPFADESNMRNAIEQMDRLGMPNRVWFAANDTPVTVTAAELRASIDSGQDQTTTIWAAFFADIGG